VTREQILARAAELINGERQDNYGPPEESMQTICNLWNSYLRQQCLDPVDVANMLALLKIARLSKGPHEDSFIDACGYLAIAGEIGNKQS
jgi:hypothetical protein